MDYWAIIINSAYLTSEYSPAFSPCGPVVQSTTHDHKPDVNAFDCDPLHFLERQFLADAVVQLGRSWRFVIRYGLGMLQGAPVLQIGRNPGGTTGVAAGRIGRA